MTLLFTLLFMFVLLLIKGFFSGSEIAFVSADRIRLRHRKAQGSAGAGTALRLLRNPAKLLTTTLLGTNISSIALTTVGTVMMVELFAGRGELVALLVFTPLFLILGEIVPKSVYQQRADALTPIIAYPLGWLQTALGPLVWLFSLIARLAARLVGGTDDDTTATRNQFFATVQMAERTGAIEAFSRGQVRRVLRFAQMTATEAMWPLSEVRCLDRNTPMKKLVELRRKTGQRLIPLYRETPTNIVAVATLESWDLLAPDIERRPVETLHGPVRFVPQLQRVSEIIAFLNADPALIVVVVDEIGNAVGLITLNLLVRGTLGAQTSPLTDRAAPETTQQIVDADGEYVIDARLPIVKVNERLEISLSTLNQSTIGGYALTRFGRLPREGDAFEADGYRFEVVEMNERSILRLSAARLG